MKKKNEEKSLDAVILDIDIEKDFEEFNKDYEEQIIEDNKGKETINVQIKESDKLGDVQKYFAMYSDKYGHKVTKKDDDGKVISEKNAVHLSINIVKKVYDKFGLTWTNGVLEEKNFITKKQTSKDLSDTQKTARNKMSNEYNADFRALESETLGFNTTNNSNYQEWTISTKL